MRKRTWYAATVLIVLLFRTSGASALEGVREINQACAAVACFAGDTAGFPVTVAGNGSYALTSDLTVPDGSTTAIQITAAGVTLDLRGFAIRGPNVCSGSPVSCTNSGAGIGVDAIFGATELVVRNGRVGGMGDVGIRMRAASRAESIRVISNGGIGIELLDDNAVVHACTVERNGSPGIGALGADVVSVERNQVSANGGNGVYVGGEALIQLNVVTFNDQSGVRIGASSLIQENVINKNNATLEEFSSGLRIQNDNRVVGNTLDDNGLRNVRVTSGDNIFDSNHLTDADLGIDFSSSSPSGYRNNTSAGNTTDYGGTGIATQVDLGGNASF